MTAPILTRPIYLRLCCVIAAAAVTVALLGGVAELWSAASRGELFVLQWGGER